MFKTRTTNVSGAIVVARPVREAFPLFSPLGEKGWVEGWDPEILFPQGAEWAEGMVFRTGSAEAPEIWIVSELDVTAHHVVYHRVEPGRLVARVEVNCRAIDAHRTAVTTAYSYVGLSVEGNAEIARWTDDAYKEKMNRWAHLIEEYLQRPQK